MGILLGNLSLDEMQERAGVAFPEEFIDYMSDKRQDRADRIAPGKWHCFDLPFMLVCGDMEVAEQVKRHLMPLSDQFNDKLQVSLQN
jgi:hypothetical protein